MKKHLAVLAFVAATIQPVAAHAAAIITFGDTAPAVPTNNDFRSLLASLGLTRYTTTGAGIVLDADSLITFHLLGTESGYSDSFSTVSAPNLGYTESTSFQNSFLAPILIGTASFGAGSLAGLLNFSSSGGAPATIGQDGFGIFLGADQLSGAAVSTFYLGYDDQINRQDDDHDDMIIRAVVSSVRTAVPEPATWAMLLAGFGLVGGALRRRKRAAVMPAVA